MPDSFRLHDLITVASIIDVWLIKMNGLISDLNMVLSSLNQISVEALSSRNHHVECFEGVATYDLSHDVVCVAMETNFQYISFERGRKVAVFDIVVIDSSLILPGR